MNQHAPISVLVPPRWPLIALVVVVGSVAILVGLGLLLGALALLDWIVNTLADTVVHAVVR